MEEAHAKQVAELEELRKEKEAREQRKAKRRAEKLEREVYHSKNHDHGIDYDIFPQYHGKDSETHLRSSDFSDYKQFETYDYEDPMSDPYYDDFDEYTGKYHDVDPYYNPSQWVKRHHYADQYYRHRDHYFPEDSYHAAGQMKYEVVSEDELKAHALGKEYKKPEPVVDPAQVSAPAPQPAPVQATPAPAPVVASKPPAPVQAPAPAPPAPQPVAVVAAPAPIVAAPAPVPKKAAPVPDVEPMPHPFHDPVVLPFTVDPSAPVHAAATSPVDHPTPLQYVPAHPRVVHPPSRKHTRPYHPRYVESHPYHTQAWYKKHGHHEKAKKHIAEAFGFEPRTATKAPVLTPEPVKVVTVDPYTDVKHVRAEPRED